MLRPREQLCYTRTNQHRANLTRDTPSIGNTNQAGTPLTPRHFGWGLPGRGCFRPRAGFALSGGFLPLVWRLLVAAFIRRPRLQAARPWLALVTFQLASVSGYADKDLTVAPLGLVRALVGATVGVGERKCREEAGGPLILHYGRYVEGLLWLLISGLPRGQLKYCSGACGEE